MADAEQIKEGLKRLVHPLLRLQKGRFRSILNGIIGALMSLMLFGCINRTPPVQLLELPDVPINNEVRRLNGSINEVAPPAVFLDLDDLLTGVAPQVAIASPKPDQIIDTTRLSAKIKLRGLSIYKDANLELGPHLQVSLDNQPARSIYSLEEDLEFLDLAPGSHTLRVLAVKPWGESFKNEAAYAQTTFHVLAKTDENTPNPEQPQLIYSAPQGTYGAQPILLDFYLNNAPLHLIAQSDPSVTDWKIRCEVNGQSFVFDQWQPIYLKGLKPGQNWVQLTLIDEQGTPIDNAFNSTVRIINYDPDRRDTLAKMTRGELQLKDVGQIVDPNYEPPIEVVAPEPVPEPAPEPEPEPLEEEKVTTEEAVPVIPDAEAEPEADKSEADKSEASSESKPQSEPEPQSESKPQSEPEAQSEPEPQSDVKSIQPNDSMSDTQGQPAVIPLTQPQPESEAVDKPNIFNRVQTFWQQRKTSTSNQPSPPSLIETTDSVTDGELIPNEPSEKSVKDEPVTDEPVKDEPVTDESITDEPVTDEPIPESKPVPEEVLKDNPPTIIPFAQPQADSGAVDKPGIFSRAQTFWQQLQTSNADQPSPVTTNNPTDDELIKDEPSIPDEPAVDQPMSDERETDERGTDERMADEPITDEPVTDQPIKDQPAIEPSIINELKSLKIPETLTAPAAPDEALTPQPPQSANLDTD